MSLIVAGATGAVGRFVVIEALRRPEITRVVALTRSLALDPAAFVERSCDCGVVTDEQLLRLRVVTFDWELFYRFWQGRKEPKSAEDVDEYGEEYYKNLFGSHKYVAMCLGTTRKDAGSAAAFVHCDYDYVVAFAEAIKTFSGFSIATYAQISAQFANKNSWLLYSKTKGRADAAVEALQFPRLCIYRPGFLDRGEKTRLNEKVAKCFVKGLPVRTCGKAIVANFFCTATLPATAPDVLDQGAKVVYYGNNDIKQAAEFD